jgi:hypothetical protein
MKHINYILTFVFGLSSCNNQTTEKAIDNNSADSIKTVSVGKQQRDIFIKDKSQYDQTFIDGLADYNEPIKLIDNYIVTGKDTTNFPEDLILNKPTIFTAIKDNNKYMLTVTRTNLTNLTYKFKLTNIDNKTLDTKSGKAILGSMFFLASESDEDTQTKESYGSYEYWDKKNDSWFVIRIGYGKDKNGKQRALINYGCDDKSKKTIDLDDCPTLRR